MLKNCVFIFYLEFFMSVSSDFLQNKIQIPYNVFNDFEKLFLAFIGA